MHPVYGNHMCNEEYEFYKELRYSGASQRQLERLTGIEKHDLSHEMKQALGSAALLCKEPVPVFSLLRDKLPLASDSTNIAASGFIGGLVFKYACPTSDYKQLMSLNSPFSF